MSTVVAILKKALSHLNLNNQLYFVEYIYNKLENKNNLHY